MVIGRIMGSWPDRAQCRKLQMNPDDFDSEFATSPIPPEIQRVCDTCPVQGECLAHALKYRESGIWGGTNETQRNAILSKVTRKYCLRCKSNNIDSRMYANKRFVVCLACGISWRIT